MVVINDGHGPGWPGPEPLETGTGTFVTGTEPEPNRGTVNPPGKSCRNRGTDGKNRTKEPRTGSPAPPVQWNRPEPRTRTGTVHPAQRFHGTGTGTGPGTEKLHQLQTLAISCSVIGIGHIIYRWKALEV